MRFALYIEAVNEEGPLCGADAVARVLADSLLDQSILLRTGTQTETSEYSIAAVSLKRWES